MMSSEYYLMDHFLIFNLNTSRFFKCTIACCRKFRLKRSIIKNEQEYVKKLTKSARKS